MLLFAVLVCGFEACSIVRLIHDRQVRQYRGNQTVNRDWQWHIPDTFESLNRLVGIDRLESSLRLENPPRLPSPTGKG